MADLHILKGCELHVHISGCLSAEDLLALGRDVYEDVDWTRFLERYEKAYGTCLNPHELYRDALNDDGRGWQRFRQHVIIGHADGGDFDRFQAKFSFGGCVAYHWRRVMGREDTFLHKIINRHRREGMDYVEYRAFGGGIEDPDAFLQFNRSNARFFQEASDDKLAARYLISLPRETPLEGYALVQGLFDESPGLIPIIVGVDFCNIEEGYPPSGMRDFFSRLHEDNQKHPERALEVAYHVGESFFDKSLESAVRWCHQAAELGARRLGHAIALGLDPAVAIGRRPHAHETELVSERVAQITYDLENQEALASFGVLVEPVALVREREALAQEAPDALMTRPYTRQRLDEIRRRQDFVLHRLVQLETVIESCPTSNLRIGGVPSPAEHPIHRFLKSDVNLVIGSDDPGTFDSPLAAEVDWVLEHTGYDADSLIERLGDPHRFRLGRIRPSVA